MRKPGGYAQITNVEPGTLVLDDRNARPQQVQAGTIEYDTFTCGHCGCVRHVRAGERPEDTGGFCRQCMTIICPRCLSTGKCDPLEKKLERAEQREHVLRSYGL